MHEQLARVEIEGIRCALGTAQRLFPETGACAIEVAGGLVAFTGSDSPLTQAYGVAATAPIGDDGVARITAFYRERGVVPKVYVTPHSDPRLGRLLAAAGYTPAEYENALASDDLSTYAERSERVTVATDIGEWARVSAIGFTEKESLDPGDDTIAIIIGESEGVVPLELRIDGAIAATAAMDVRSGWGALFAGSTLAPYRNQGIQLELIRDRIARARDAGARFLRATALPGSTSERNFHRCGLRTLYTRTLWELSPSS